MRHNGQPFGLAVPHEIAAHVDAKVDGRHDHDDGDERTAPSICSRPWTSPPAESTPNCTPDIAVRMSEFKTFVNHLDREVPDGLEVHLILDNYSTHKTQRSTGGCCATPVLSATQIDTGGHRVWEWLAGPGRRRWLREESGAYDYMMHLRRE